MVLPQAAPSRGARRIDGLQPGTISNFKPVIHPGKQGKHIPGHNNFQSGRSELTHPDPQGLLNKSAGTGIRHGSKEVVDFGEEIGIWVSKNGARMSTTRSTIHYDAKGNAHIGPAKPVP